MENGMFDLDAWKYINTILFVASIPLTFFVYRMSLKKNPEVMIKLERRASYLRRAIAYFIDLVICLNIGWLITKALSVSNFVHWPIAFVAVFSSIVFFYFVLLEGSRLKGTIGKLSMGIEVVNIDGTGISITKSSLRLFLNIFIGMCFPLMNIVIFFTKYRQCSFEVLSNTLVVIKFDQSLVLNENNAL